MALPLFVTVLALAALLMWPAKRTTPTAILHIQMASECLSQAASQQQKQATSYTKQMLMATHQHGFALPVCNSY